MTPRATAEIFAELMAGLGYQRFLAHGSDFGTDVVTQLALDYPKRLAGLHISTFDWRPYLGPQARSLTAAEREYLQAVAAAGVTERAYDEIQSTKPQSLGYGLNDSPAGLAGWIIEKWRSWSDCDGDVIERFGRDFLCATLTIYRVTQTATSAARFYYDHRRHQAPFGPRDRVMVPTAVAAFHRLFMGEPVPPREWAERIYNVRGWTEMPRGGHFAATEEPLLLAADIAAFCRQAIGSSRGV
jgi:pimeloyl-ACP methyl ester carboxylesterase